AEEDVGRRTRTGGRITAAQVVRGDLLVHGICLHVLVEVPARPSVGTEPARTRGIQPVRAGRGHLECSQVPEQGTYPPAVHGEQGELVSAGLARQVSGEIWTAPALGQIA